MTRDTFAAKSEAGEPTAFVRIEAKPYALIQLLGPLDDAGEIYRFDRSGDFDQDTIELNLKIDSTNTGTYVVLNHDGTWKLFVDAKV